MSQTLTLQADLAMTMGEGRHRLTVPSGTVLTYPDAGSTEVVAEILREHSTTALHDNLAALAHHEVIGSDDYSVVYGVNGERIATNLGTPPVISTATVENAAPTIVVITFDKNINSATPDYKLGVTIKKGGVSQTISSATRQTDHKIVKYTLSGAIANGDVVTFSYVNATGDLVSDTGGDFQTVTNSAVTNNVV